MKWGIIGLGYMAKMFASSFANINNGELIAISSKSSLKLTKFGKKFNINSKYRFKNYDEILNCKEIENIYISTINNSHFDLILKSINANKNILCEKPITINSKDALIVYNKLKKKKLFFMEALPYRTHPLMNFLIKTIKKKTIGKIINMDLTFGIKKKAKSNNHRLFNPELGGGAILDLGCYPVTFSNIIANINNQEKNQTPKLADVSGTIFKTGVDDLSYLTLKYDNKIISKIGVSITSVMENKAIIYGTEGKITIVNPWSPEKKSFIEIGNDKRYYKLFIKSESDLLTNQINLVNKFITDGKTEGDYPCMSWKDSVDNALILEEWKNLLIKKDENQKL
jgi:dihydrodiol dehydrogenase / D-xylose 1-dehydrogenase (NADP)